MENDTIAAIATPIGSSGIGIIRISGPDAILLSKRLFLPHGYIAASLGSDFVSRLESHRLHYGHVVEPDTHNIVDEVLMVVMRAPRSYTREDVVEIQSHAGAVVLRKILSLVIESGCRMAEPGEFTKRAFLNGRIDLSQAEAVAEMISAKSETGLKLATTHLTGQFKRMVLEFIDFIKQVQIELEAAIEFPDEVDPVVDYSEISAKLRAKVLEPVKKLIQHYDDGHLFRDGIRIDIVGRPNVGKSSLLNALIQKDKAIVTHIPGTTRDLIEDCTSIDGIPIIVTDTAGIHHTADPVEVIGIHKTKENLERSDLVLWVVDGSIGFTQEDQNVYQQILDCNTLLVVNKIDLVQDGDQYRLQQAPKNLEQINVSAKFGYGLIDLKQAIKKNCLNQVHIEPGRSLVPNLRQAGSLKTAMAYLVDALDGLDEQRPEELIVSDLTSASNTLGLITGATANIDLIDEIFSRFCIGK
jgi:tRNA modification GTPase